MVLPTEGVPRRVMWEKVCIKMHHSEIFSEMFLMATATFFLGKQAVVATTFLDPSGQGRVTGQASFGVCAWSSELMALGAIRQSLQLGMGGGQLPRGQDLSLCRPRVEQEQKDGDCPWAGLIEPRHIRIAPPQSRVRRE